MSGGLSRFFDYKLPDFSSLEYGDDHIPSLEKMLGEVEGISELGYQLKAGILDNPWLYAMTPELVEKFAENIEKRQDDLEDVLGSIYHAFENALLLKPVYIPEGDYTRAHIIMGDGEDTYEAVVDLNNEDFYYEVLDGVNFDDYVNELKGLKFPDDAFYTVELPKSSFGSPQILKLAIDRLLTEYSSDNLEIEEPEEEIVYSSGWVPNEPQEEKSNIPINTNNVPISKTSEEILKKNAKVKQMWDDIGIKDPGLYFP